MKYKFSLHFVLTIWYFLLASIEIISELFSFTFFSLITRILIPVSLAALYWSITKRHNLLFYLIVLLLLITMVLFFFKNSVLFFYGVIAFILLRGVSLLLVIKATKEINYLHIVVASFPFLVVFFYLISVTNEITEIEFNTLIIQSLLISILAGISITNYFKHENRQHSWLLISTLLFIGLRFFVFIERFVVSDLSLVINRPIEIALSTFAFFTFFKYVIASEVASTANSIIR